MRGDDYDVFISYAHRDDHDGWVKAFRDALCAEHARYTRAPLRIFLDVDGIRSMEDWEHRILAALRSSRVMIAVMSPHFFESPWCRREWEIWVEHEVARALPGEGIAPVYTVTTPGFEDEAQAALDRWLGNLRRRQYVDVREWRPQGPEALRREDARRRIEALDQQLDAHLTRATRAAASPTTVPPHNEHFVGRTDELRRIHEALALGKVGAITAVHGLGGMGKSALAFEYAHAYADHYPGGRFLVPCAGVTDLRLPIVNLAPHLGVTLSEEERASVAAALHRGVTLKAEERASVDAAFARVRAALERRERTLVLLDNVDDPKVLAPAIRARALPSCPSVHALVTTRLEPERLTGMTHVALDSLAEADALLLLAKYRPFDDEAEREAARRIVRMLGGYALVVEALAVYLWQTADEGVTYAGTLASYEAEGVESILSVSADERVELSRHEEKALTAVLAPTIESLNVPERLTLLFATQLPPDSIVVPWLRAMVARLHPELADAPGRASHLADPWKRLLKRLRGLRLLLSVGDEPVARMHRMVAHVVEGHGWKDQRYVARNNLASHLAQLAIDRGYELGTQYADVDGRWEIEALFQFARSSLQDLRPWCCIMVNAVSRPLMALGRFADASKLLRDLLGSRQCPALAGIRPTLWASACANLAAQEFQCGQFESAAELLQEAIALEGSAAEPDAESIADHLASLGGCFQGLGRIEEARDALRRALTALEAIHGPNSPRLSVVLNNLGILEVKHGDAREGQQLLRRDIENVERDLGPTHPDLVTPIGNLCQAEQALGNMGASLTCAQRALAILEQHFTAHPHLTRYRKLAAEVEIRMGRVDDARARLLTAIAAEEASTASDSDPVSIPSLYCSLGLFERDLGDVARAEECFRIAISQGEERGMDAHNLAACNFNLGRLFVKHGRAAEAVRYLQQAVELLRSAGNRVDGSLLAQVTADLATAMGTRDGGDEESAGQHAARTPRA